MKAGKFEYSVFKTLCFYKISCNFIILKMPESTHFWFKKFKNITKKNNQFVQIMSLGSAKFQHQEVHEIRLRKYM
jgi:hypothetical protein